MGKNKTSSERSETALANISKVFQDSSAIQKRIDSGEIERRNLPPMTKPGDCPIGGVLIGEIIRLVNSPTTAVKGKLLWLRLENGAEITFPLTGTIRSALAPGREGDEIETAIEKEVGKILVLKRLEDKQSDKYKKSMFMFDVFTMSK